MVIKHRYSAFINTDLNTVLRAKGIQSVMVTGVATNVCVETTARDAYMFDYYVTMIDNCVAAYDPKLHENTLENIRCHAVIDHRYSAFINTDLNTVLKAKGIQSVQVGIDKCAKREM